MAPGELPRVRLDMLPGIDGDALLLQYTVPPGNPGAGTRRILIDGGRTGSYPLFAPRLADPDGNRPILDVVVVTHVDQDHVLGILALLEDPDRPEIRDVWFNGYDHLIGDGLEHLGPRDGELLTDAIEHQKLGWNAAFARHSVLAGRSAAPFGDGSVFTVLSPDRDQLRRLAPVWAQECARHGLIPGSDPVPPPAGFESFGGSTDIEALAATRFSPDSSRTNATSIGFLFEYAGVRLVFTGDGGDARLAASLRPLAEAAGGRLRIDALKVSHHGSAANLSRELLELLDCPRYLISTSGARHHHPDAATIARILKYGGEHKELVFNYAERAAVWDVAEWRQRYGYTVRGPDPGADGFATLHFLTAASAGPRAEAEG